MNCEPNSLAIFLDFLKTVLGVGVGAWLAFKANRRAQEILKKEAELAAANIASLCLSRQWNDYRVFQKEIARYQDEARRQNPSLPPWEDLPKAMQLPTIPKHFDDSVRFDFDKLYFLFGKGHESLLGELTVVENRYANFSLYVRTYNDLRVEAHKKLSDSAEAGKEFSVEEARRLLGNSLHTQLEFYAKAILEALPSNKSHIEGIAPILEQTLLERFGKKALVMKIRF